MMERTLQIRGDQIGRYESLSGQGNNSERVVTLDGVQALGTRDEIYTITFEQINPGSEQFENGQFFSLYDPSGQKIVSRAAPRPDEQQHLAGGDEHLIVSSHRLVIDLNGLPAESGRVEYTHAGETADPSRGDNDGELDFEDFPCFVPGTLIATPEGPRDVASLQPGDLVSTQEGGSVAILWVGRRSLSLAGREPRQAPVEIKPGAFGEGCPSRPLVLSPDHRVLVRDPACRYLFEVDEVDEVLAPAKALTGLPLVRSMAGKKHIDFISILTAWHAVLLAEGQPAESLYPGSEALRRLEPEQRQEVLAHLPGLKDGEVARLYPPARRLLSTREAETLVQVMRLRGSLEEMEKQPLPEERPALRLIS